MSTEQERTRILIIDKYLQDTNQSFASIGRAININRNTVRRVVQKFLETKSTARRLGSGRPQGPADPLQARKILKILKRNPHLSGRDVARKLGCHESLIRRVKKRYGLKSFKIQTAPCRDEKNEKMARTRARKLYDRYLTKNTSCLLMDDETYVKSDFRQLPGQGFYVAAKRFGVRKEFRTKCLSKFANKYLVW